MLDLRRLFSKIVKKQRKQKARQQKRRQTKRKMKKKKKEKKKGKKRKAKEKDDSDSDESESGKRLVALLKENNKQILDVVSKEISRVAGGAVIKFFIKRT